MNFMQNVTNAGRRVLRGRRQRARRQASRRRLGMESLENRNLMAVLSVTSLDDGTLGQLAGDGQLSLREAIHAANTNTSVDGSVPGDPGLDTIVFEAGLSGFIRLDDASLDVTEALHLIGSGSSNLTIDGGTTNSRTGAREILNVTNADVSIEGVLFFQAENGLLVNGGSSVALTDVEFRSNKFYGVRLENTGDVVFTNVVTTLNGRAGVLVQGANSFVEMDGHHFLNDDGGVELSEIAGDVMFSRTMIENNDRDDNGIGTGILSTGVAPTIGGNLVIRGATIRDMDGPGPIYHQDRGIRVQDIVGEVIIESDPEQQSHTEVSGHADTGIDLRDTGAIRLSSVDVNGNYHGLEVRGAPSVTIDESSSLSNNMQDGAYLSMIADLVSVSGVTINANGDDGLVIVEAPTATITGPASFSNNGHDGISARSVGGVLSIVDTTASGNAGAGLSIWHPGAVTVDNSTLSNNQFSGIESSSSLTVNNSTISGNSSPFSGGGIDVAYGDGLHLTVNNSTIVGNRANSEGSLSGDGGGIRFQSNGGSVELHSSIVAGNVRGALGADSPSDLSGDFDVASSFNLIGTGEGATGITDGVNSNRVGTTLSPIDPLLGLLADNGGPTQTHGLLSGSPAIDAGSNPLNLAFDQRGDGFARTQGTATDIGAFERFARVPQPVVYVDDDFANTPLGDDPDGAGPATEFGVDAFASIQEGVDTVIPAGTVHIHPGNYPENVAVGKDIVLDGTSASAGDVIVNPAAGDGISITSGNVVIRDLTVRDALRGINQIGGGDLTLSNVHLLNNTENGINSFGAGSIDLTNVHATDNGVDGVGFQDVQGSVRVTGGNFSNNGDDGAVFESVNGPVDVEGATIANNVDDGLRLLRVTGALNVTDAAFNNNGDDGLLITSHNGDVAISGSTFELNAGDGVDIESIVGSVSLQAGTFSQNGDDGIEIDVITGSVLIDAGDFANNGGHGVEIENSSGTISLTQAAIQGNGGAGVYVQHAAAFHDTDSVIRGNAAHGIELSDVTGDVTLTRTTLEDNDADNDGVGDGLNVASSLELPFTQVDGIAADAGSQLFVAEGSFLYSLPTTLTFSSFVGVLDHFSSGLAFDGTNLLSISSSIRLHTVDPGNASTIASVAITLPGQTVNRVEGLAVHPTTGQIYALLRVDGRNTPELVTIDPNSGVATSIGDTGDTFADITFDSAGTLYGVTRASTFSVMPEGLFTLSTTDASSTAVLALPRGDGRREITFSPGDGLIHLASQSGDSALFQVIDPSVPGAQVLNFGIGGNLTIAGARFRDTDGQRGAAHQQRGVYVGASVLGDVRLESSSGVVQSVEVTGHEQNGVDINGAGSVTITGGIFSNNDADGIEVDDAGPVSLTNVTAEQNGQDGVELRDIGEVLIANVTSDNNGAHGLRIADRQGEVTILGSSFSGNNSAEGIDIASGRGALQLTDVTANNNANEGLNLTSFRGAATILRGSYSGNDDEGISAAGSNSSDGVLTVIDATVDRNRSAGLRVRDATSVTVQGSSFSNNLRPGSTNGERGIDLRGISGDVTLTQTTVDGNSGPGVITAGTNLVRVDSSTISNNGARGLEISSGSLEVVNSTISGNHTAGSGGGIFFNVGTVNGGTLNVFNSTITGNRADSDGDGIGDGGGISSDSIPPLLRSTIVAGNVRGAAGADVPSDLSETFFGLGDFNLIGSAVAAGGIVDGSNGNQVGTPASPIDPQLGPLADNGGPTQTHALLPGSPAIDAGDSSAGIPFDQRGNGFPRTKGIATDVGAFEAEPPVNEQPVAAPQGVTTAEDTPLTITLSGDDGDPSVVQSLTFTIGNGPSHGRLSGFNPATGEVVYTPDGEYSGPDSFTFTVTDDDTVGGPALTSAAATVQIDVTPVNDNPTVPIDVDSTANEVAEGAVAGTRVGISANSSDIDSPSVSYRLTNDAGGRFAINAGTGAVSVANGALFEGPAMHTITVEASDGQGGGSTADFEISVTNVAPSVASAMSVVTVNEGQTAVIGGTYGDPGADAVSLSASAGTITDHGDGTWSWSLDTSDGPDQSQVVTITATDSDGASSTTSFNLVVENVAPAIVADNATVTVAEGQTATNSGTYSDVGADGVSLSASIGTIVEHGNGTWSWSMATSNGPSDSRVVTITATDSDGASSTTSFNLVVENVAPAIMADNATVTVAEGQTATNSGTYNDVGADGVSLSASIGTIVEHGNGTWSWSLATSNGPSDSRVVTITATDSDGAQSSTAFNLVVENVAPAIVADNATVTVAEGQTATNSGTYNDVGADGVSLSASIGTIVEHGNGTWSWSLATSNGPSDSRVVTITATDSDGAQSSTAFNLVVTQVELDLTVSVSSTSPREGQSVTLRGQFVNAPQRHTVRITWGDGQADVISLLPGQFNFSLDHVYEDDDPSGTPSDAYQILVRVLDQSNDRVVDRSQAVLVQNVPPSLGTLALSPATLPAGGQTNLSGVFFDPGVRDTLVLDIDWDGDGQYETSVPVDGGTFTLDYTPDGEAGTHLVHVRLRDDDGGATTATLAMTVLPPPPATFVQDAHLFYNHSAFDGNGTAVTPADFAAIDPTKDPLAWGNTATFANVSGYSRGINGVFIDVANLPADGAGIDPTDFLVTVGNTNFPDQWAAGPRPQAVGVFPNLGVGGSDRIFVAFADNSLVDTWVRLTLKANADTGLATDEDFFFGSVAGDTGAALLGQGQFFGRDASDFLSIAIDLFDVVGPDNPNDTTKNGLVDSIDLQVIPVASGGGVQPAVIGAITPQLGTPGLAAVSAVVDEAVALNQDELGTPPAGIPDSAHAAASDEPVAAIETDERDLAFATFDDDAMQPHLPDDLSSALAAGPFV